ncbi:hypothetical protein ACFP2T_27120 [Plantactinospora solaniradicis]|uniref:Uncharacterized protein n=1 Tax=Plantactinospora solaniradicis TaxID=1723736 RepID=A0ABW1KF21_9ACTN
MTAPQDTTDEAMTEPPPLNFATDGADIVAIAWPTRRPIYAYTREEIAEGVDVYTRAMKARAAAARAVGGDDAPE